MRLKFFFITLFIAICYLAGCGNFQSSEKTIAIINGKKISYKQFEGRISKMPPYYQTIAHSRPRQLLDDMITEEVLYEEAMKRNLENDKYIQEVFSEAKKKILITRLLEEIAKKKMKIDQDQIKKYYDEHIADFTIPEKVNVSHILVIDEQKAQGILSQLKKWRGLC